MIRIILGAYSVVVFVAALVIHIKTFGDSPESPSDPVFVLLHFAVLIGFGACLIALIERDARAGDGHVTYFRLGPVLRRSVAAFVLWAVMLTYAAVNFFVSSSHLRDGYPERGAEGPFLEDHGKFVRLISEDEYRQLSAYQARMFSGGWMLFSMFPCMFLFTKKREHAPPA